MSIPVPKPASGKRPVPVPHEVAVPLERDNRWKYGLAIAIIVLLLLLLLLLSFSSGAGSSGTGSGGAGQGGDSAGTGAGGDGGTTAAESTGAKGTGNSPAVAESTKSDNESSGETGTPKTTAEAESKTGDGSTPLVAATEPPSDLAIEELIRRLSAESDDDASSQSDTDQRRSSQSGGDALVKGDATVNFFGATGRGSRFVFVFDRSSSMRGRPLETVKRELIKSLEPLRSNHSFNIISYDSSYEMWSPRLVTATPESKANAIRFIESTESRGGTQPREPLLEAINQRPEIIFFMTDGEFTLDVDEITRNRRGIIINTIQFSDGNVPLMVLQELAKRTGGEFMLVPVRGLSDAL